MNKLEYVLKFNSDSVEKFNDQGYDLQTLQLIGKDIFQILTDLGIVNKEAAEFIMRLKNVSDSRAGKPVSPLEESGKQHPNRLSVESKVTGNNYFFKLIAGQGSVVEKGIVKYTCENCGQGLQRNECKTHVQEVHDNQ